MSDLTKKAAEMLLKGATLLSEPCPYCRGVRVMHDGNALCVSCGRTPEKNSRKTATINEKPHTDTADKSSSTIQALEKKLESLGRELELEKDHKKQLDILESINSIIDTLDKMR